MHERIWISCWLGFGTLWRSSGGTEANHIMAKEHWRVRVLYAVLWLPVATLYVAMFTLSQGASIGWAALNAFINVGAAALLGLAVIALTARARWPGRIRPGFLLLHAGLAAAYSLSWFAAIMVGHAALRWSTTGTWALLLFRGAALHWQLFQGIFVYAAIACLAYTAHALHEAAEQRERAAEADLRASRAEAVRTAAELQILRAQLNPHFLFNTLHTVQSLVRYDPAAAASALERLGSLLRYSLHGGSSQGCITDVSLQEEWAFVQEYLCLERLRLGARLRVETDLAPETMVCAIPALTLQPVVENAVKYAVAPRAGGGTIRIRSYRSPGWLHLEVADDGPGVSAEAIRTTRGQGLRLVARQLETRHGTGAKVVVRNEVDGFAVKLRIPSFDHFEATENDAHAHC